MQDSDEANEREQIRMNNFDECEQNARNTR